MASRGINKVILIGNVGRDPEIKSFPNGECVASLTLATSESWRDKNTGEAREKSEWHRVSVFGATANFVNNYVQKGSQLYIEGQLQTRKWQDQSGQDRYTTEVVVRWPNGLVQLLGSSNQASVTESNGVAQKTTTPSQPVAVPQQTFQNSQQSWDTFPEDDIPF